jgi:hypothetical protein
MTTDAPATGEMTLDAVSWIFRKLAVWRLLTPPGSTEARPRRATTARAAVSLAPGSPDAQRRCQFAIRPKRSDRCTSIVQATNWLPNDRDVTTEHNFAMTSSESECSLWDR